MPKIKTHKGAAKRFKITPTGKMKREHAFGNHLLEHKTQDQKRGYRKSTEVAASDRGNVRKMLGAG